MNTERINYTLLEIDKRLIVNIKETITEGKSMGKPKCKLSLQWQIQGKSK